MTAQLRLIAGGIADRNVHGLDHAMQARKAEPRPAARKGHLALVTGSRKIRCGCGHNECNAPELEAAWLLHEAAWQADPTQDRTAADLAKGAYRVAMVACTASITHPKFGDMRQRLDNTWEEFCAAGWMQCPVVSVYVKVGGEYRDVLYKVIPSGGRYVARALDRQGLSGDDAEQHERAALAQWELERSL